jgi:haloacetate dehalogenase
LHKSIQASQNAGGHRYRGDWNLWLCPAFSIENSVVSTGRSGMEDISFFRFLLMTNETAGEFLSRPAERFTLLANRGCPMFEGFLLEKIEVPSGIMRVRHGGSGPPVLLLHGHPRTHATWWQVAERLAPCYQVICPDLPGFGQSYVPADNADHAGSSKRAEVRAVVELMTTLGHERFAVVGHDRGSYTGFRLAMDHPEKAACLAVLDGVPILEALERANAKFAGLWWHWFFFGVLEKPERAVLADADAWYGGSPEQMGREAYGDFRAATRDPVVVHGMIEDYRAGLGIDRQHDAEDRAAGRRVECAMLCLWSKFDDLQELYGDVLAVWRPWANDVTGHAIASGHHMAEEAPEELGKALMNFLGHNNY